jgi:hypothetical protein
MIDTTKNITDGSSLSLVTQVYNMRISDPENANIGKIHAGGQQAAGRAYVCIKL